MSDLGEIDIAPFEMVDDKPTNLPEKVDINIFVDIPDIDTYFRLVNLVKQHNYLYHIKNQPIITDTEFDKLFSLLKKAEEDHPDWIVPDSPTQVVGGIENSGKKYRHPVKMYSLSNVFNENELHKFLKRFNPIRNTYSPGEVDQYYCDCKMDGLAVSLLYRDGRLTLALTRGNGEIGENVTANIEAIPNVPLRIKTKYMCLVRGEVVVHLVDFYAANREQLAQKKEPFSNPRNYATGSLKQKDPKVTRDRKLRFYAWELIVFDKPRLTQEEQMKALVDLGFNVPKGKMCYSQEEIMSFIHEIERLRDELLYTIDGVVIKQNDIKFRKELGWNNHDPLWATAWKFTNEGSSTEITDITWSIGRSGKLTPIASLNPVMIDGVKVKNVTLNNATYVEQQQIGKGANVVVIRSGDVIPKITEILTRGTYEEIPVKCPYCGEPTIRFGAELKCINPYCKGILYAVVNYIISKDVLDIRGLGEQFAKEAIETGSITSFEDLFGHIDTKDETRCPQHDLDLLVTRVRDINLMKLLMILGISKMGRAIAGKITIEVGNLQGFIHLLEDPKEMEMAPFNDSIKTSMKDWYSVEYNRQLLDHINKLKLPNCQ